MANLGYGLTASQINKVLGKGEWSDSVRMNCYMIAAIAELPDNTALAQFTMMLNTLGITQANHTKINDETWVDTFSQNGKVAATLSELDMRKAIAEKVFGDASKHKMLNAVVGEDLQNLYNVNFAKAKDELPFVIHRMRIGKNIIFKVTQDAITPAQLVKDAIRMMIANKGAKEEDYKSLL